MVDQPAGGVRRVDTTGLVVVHENELIVPDSDSAAQLSQAAADPRTIVEFHFPVTIEVRAAEPVDPDLLAHHTLTRLAQGLES